MNSALKMISEKIEKQSLHLQDFLRKAEGELATLIKKQVYGIKSRITVRLQMNSVKLYLRDEPSGAPDVTVFIDGHTRKGRVPNYRMTGVQLGSHTHQFNIARNKDALSIAASLAKKPGGDFGIKIKQHAARYLTERSKLEKLVKDKEALELQLLNRNQE